MMYFYTIWMIEFLYNFKFSVWIFRILKNLFYSYFFLSRFFFSFVYHSKCSLSNYFNPRVLLAFIFRLCFLGYCFSLVFSLYYSCKLRFIVIENIGINLRFFIWLFVAIHNFLLFHNINFKRGFRIFIDNFWNFVFILIFFYFI